MMNDELPAARCPLSTATVSDRLAQFLGENELSPLVHYPLIQSVPLGMTNIDLTCAAACTPAQTQACRLQLTSFWVEFAWRQF